MSDRSETYRARGQRTAITEPARRVRYGVRLLLGLLVCAWAVPVCPAQDSRQPGEIQLTQKALYQTVRVSASPSGGRPVPVNPPPLLWPATKGKDVRYAVRLSQDRSFRADKTIGNTGQPWAVFNPHRKLAAGTWYWQYAVLTAGAPDWSPTQVFQVAEGTRVFETHTAREVVAACPRTHPRLLVRAGQLEAFRQRAKGLKATAAVITLARKQLGQPLPREQDAVPKAAAENKRQAQKLASDASKDLGLRVKNAVTTLSQAYLVTGDKKFGAEAARWAVHTAKWDRTGVSGQNNLGDMFCLEAMVLAYDSCYDLLTEADKQQLLQGIRARAGHYFSIWMNRLEVLIHREHYWGHILERTLQAAVATLGDLPEAEQWLTYGYEVWLARTPSAGGDDGGWMLGTNYNGIEGEALVGIPTLFQNLTGDDLFAAPFYRNNLYFLIYCQPPQSYGDGFGDAHEMEKGPRPFQLRYVEALGRRLGDRYASWYLQKSGRDEAKRASKKKGLEWTELGWGKELQRPAWTGPFDLPQARAFRQTGVVAMHTNLAEPTQDLFVSFRSSPWGSYSHAQADQNTFNVVVGGERLFYASGYKMPVGDPHMLGWYKHTRGHNGILIDGKGQTYGTEAYGWIPRYLHGERITYCVGDASRAYDAKPAADEETPANPKLPEKLPDGQAGLKHFRRHVLLLRPNTVVVYDDLVADHLAEWSWLLHSMEKMRLEADRHRLFATAKKARSRVDLFGAVPLRFDLTGHFGVPAVNWRGKTDREGNELDYADDQWHFTAISARKAPAMRYLAVLQIRQGGDAAEFADVTPGPGGWLRAGDWQIRAELDAGKRPYLEVRNSDGTAGLVTGQPRLTLGEKVYDARKAGSTLLVEKVADQWRVQEAVDEAPDVAR